MANAWQRYMDLVSGLTQVTQKRAEQVVRVLVRRGEIEAIKGEKTVEGLVSRVEANRKAVTSMARSEIEDAVRRLGLARQSDIERLQAKIARLEAELHSRPVKTAPVKKGGAKRAGRKATAEQEAPPTDEEQGWHEPDGGDLA
ncbi:MAG: hypothetical protein ACRD0K_21250 [Egibacteraceae bacterium]